MRIRIIIAIGIVLCLGFSWPWEAQNKEVDPKPSAEEQKSEVVLVPKEETKSVFVRQVKVSEEGEPQSLPPTSLEVEQKGEAPESDLSSLRGIQDLQRSTAVVREKPEVGRAVVPNIPTIRSVSSYKKFRTSVPVIPRVKTSIPRGREAVKVIPAVPELQIGSLNPDLLESTNPTSIANAKREIQGIVDLHDKIKRKHRDRLDEIQFIIERARIHKRILEDLQAPVHLAEEPGRISSDEVVRQEKIRLIQNETEVNRKFIEEFEQKQEAT